MVDYNKKNILFRLFTKHVVLAIVLLAVHHVFGQRVISAAPDAAIKPDSTIMADSISKKVDSTFIKAFLLTQQILKKHPYFNYTDKAEPLAYAQKKKSPDKDLYFYILAGILLVFAVFRSAFDKYFADLMTLFFRRSLKQRQLKQQVSQNSLPSLLFNTLFVIVAGFYIALLVNDFGSPPFPFWELLIYSIGFVAATYLVKFLTLKLAGWMFQMERLTNSYIFIIFLVNKIIGIALLPIIVVTALANIELKTVMLGLSWLILGGLFIYRFIQAFGLLRKEKRISAFHFLLYLLAFEILPILVIYKAMAGFLDL